MRALIFLAFFATPAFAQDQNLADIRAELGIVRGAVEGLRAELAPGAGSNLTISGDTLQRIDAIEAALSRLTSKTESLENRINRVVSDGTNRVGDLEFRVCEIEPGCDLASVGKTEPLGGGTGLPVPQVAPQPETTGPELAVSEKADFERAQEALASGDFRGAAEKFAAFTQSYPGGPLEADAHFFRGDALEKAGDWNQAARSYLESFSGSPESLRAPAALYRLGIALNELGQTSEACLMLEEVGKRFPASDQVTPAMSALNNLGCS